MQQSPQMFPTMVPSIPPSNITTEQIQKYLDENKKLIMAIMENQNLGKLAECAQYQALLQKNLMYLAAIADAQPPPPTTGAAPAPAMASQMTAPHPSMQPPSYFMQHPQASGMAPQQASPAGIFLQEVHCSLVAHTSFRISNSNSSCSYTNKLCKDTWGLDQWVSATTTGCSIRCNNQKPLLEEQVVQTWVLEEEEEASRMEQMMANERDQRSFVLFII
ncbi:hypothetical protein Bca52824_013560 [Brassica carinata]|uniref:SS18 N-terminal domain-containing protein n=1 Tax=Brassica carinata TaxID=52824 RepID=A0A8X8B3K1_BRACI|nr:hypothetical protein Bca52824_013560 [Brassica carinata]